MGKKTWKELSRDKKRDIINKHIFVYAMLAIPIVHYFIFWVGVNIDCLVLPFQDNETGKFTLDNFKMVFEVFETGGFGIELRNTLIYWVAGLLNSFVLSLFVTYFVYKKIKGYRLFTFMFMLPSMISSVVFVAIYKNIISTTGPLAVLYEKVCGESLPALLYQNSTATWMIVLYGLWSGFGGNIIMFLGTMSKIPKEVTESASIDGAGFFREFFSIVLPLMLPTIYTMLLFSVTGFLMATGPILLFTGGMYETSTISYWFYEKVIIDRNYGLSSAFGLLLTAIGAPLALFVNHLAKKVENVEF